MRFLHLLQVSSKLILSWNHKHPWKMVNSLEMLHLHQPLRLHSLIAPAYVPLIIIINIRLTCESHLEHMPPNVPDHLILRIQNIHDQSPRLHLSLLPFWLLRWYRVLLRLEPCGVRWGAISVSRRFCNDNEVVKVGLRILSFVRTMIWFVFIVLVWTLGSFYSWKWRIRRFAPC